VIKVAPTDDPVINNGISKGIYKITGGVIRETKTGKQQHLDFLTIYL
jgi:hypothetical protein